MTNSTHHLYKVAYIELDTHAEIALNFMELMKGSQDFSVDYFFSSKILNQLGVKESQNIKLATPENLFQQLSAQNYQVVIIGTVHRYFNTFKKIAEKFNTAVICHNLNFVKASKWNLLTSVFKEDIQYRLKLLWKEGLLKKSKVYQAAKHLLVLDDHLTGKGYKNLPLFYTKFNNHPENDVFTMVIPGAVSQKRRDYEEVLKRLRQEVHKKIEIIFLGKAQGQELQWLQDFENLHLKDVNIKFFTEKIKQNLFDYYMQKADLLWCPIQQETAFFSQKEFYGTTKMSGNIGDAIKFSKTAVFPENYPSKYGFIVTDKNHLEKLFSVKKDADFSEFTQEKVFQNLEKIVKELL